MGLVLNLLYHFLMLKNIHLQKDFEMKKKIKNDK